MMWWTLVACLTAVTTMAQPAFEVASVRVNESGSNARGGTQFSLARGHASFRNYPLSALIAFAYRVDEHQVLKAPSWAMLDGFDVEAKASGPVTEADGRLMMQALLRERFQLRIHWDKVEVQGYTLRVAKGGPKLRPAKPEDGRGFRIMTGGEIRGPGDMQMFAGVLKVMLRTPVRDETRLPDVYDIALRWQPDVAQEGGVPIFTAIREQLGLELKAGKVLEDAIVFESADRIPSEN